MYLYIDIYSYMHIYICIIAFFYYLYKPMYVYIYMYVCRWIHTYIYIHVYIYIYIYTCVYIYIYICMYVYMYASQVLVACQGFWPLFERIVKTQSLFSIINISISQTGLLQPITVYGRWVIATKGENRSFLALWALNMCPFYPKSIWTFGVKSSKLSCLQMVQKQGRNPIPSFDARKAPWFPGNFWCRNGG